MVASTKQTNAAIKSSATIIPSSFPSPREVRDGVQELDRDPLDPGRLVQAVHDLAGIVEVGLGVVDILRQADPGEVPVAHPAEDDVGRHLQVERGVGDLDELPVQLELLVLLVVVVVPGELHEAPPVVHLPVGPVGLPVGLALAFPVLGDRLNGLCRLPERRGEEVGKPAVVPALLLAVVEQRVLPVHLALLHRAREQAPPHGVVVVLPVDRSDAHCRFSCIWSRRPDFSISSFKYCVCTAISCRCPWSSFRIASSLVIRREIASVVVAMRAEAASMVFSSVVRSHQSSTPAITVGKPTVMIALEAMSIQVPGGGALFGMVTVPGSRRWW